MKTRTAVLAVLTSLLITQVAAAAQPLPDRSDASLWTTNSTVNGVVTIGSTTYLGGSFTYLGPRNGAGLYLDPASGQPAGPSPMIAGIVNAAISDGAGGVYLAGDLYGVGGVPVRSDAIVHLRADGTADPAFRSPPLGSTAGVPFVSALALQNGRLYAGGGFTEVGGQAHDSLVALDATSGAVLGADVDLRDGADLGSASAMVATADGRVVVGGRFTAVAGSPRVNLAAIDADGSVSAYDFGGQHPVGDVYALEATDDWLYIGGSFTKVGQSSGPYLRRYHLGGALDLTWKPAPDNTVITIEATSQRVYVAGNLTSLGGQSRPGVGAASATGTGAALDWNPAPQAAAGSISDARVIPIAAHGNTVMVGGLFGRAGGQDGENLARVDAATGDAVGPTVNIGGSVARIVDTGDRLFVTGDFASYGGVRRQFLAALGPDGTPTTWNPGADRPVRSMVASPDRSRLYVGGEFTSIGGAARAHVAAFAPGSDVPLAFDPSADDLVSSLALAPDGGTLYLGGAFSHVGQAPRAHLAAVDAGSGGPTPLDPHPDGRVDDLRLDGERLLVSGPFTHLGAQAAQPARAGIGAVSLASGDATDFAPVPIGGDVSLARPLGDATYLGGTFTALGGTARLRVAAIDPAGVTAFDPHADGSVQALEPSDAGTVLVGGDFSAVGGAAQPRLAELDAASGAATAWRPDLRYAAYRLFAAGRDVWVSGGFAEGAAPGGYLYRYTRPADPAGASDGGSSPQTPPLTGPPADITPPRVLAATLTATRFAPGTARTALSAATRRTPRGTTLHARFSEPASLRITILRVRSGRRVGSRCLAPSRALARRRSCTRTSAAGMLTRATPTAVATLRFTGRLGRRALARGRYRMVIVARDAAGNRSAPRTLSFRVVKG